MEVDDSIGTKMLINWSHCFIVRLSISFLIFASFFFALPANAQELHQDVQGTWRARVVDMVSEEEREVPGTDVTTAVQTLDVEILEGERKGAIVRIENDFMQLKEGEAFFLNYLITINGTELYNVSEPDRRAVLYILIGLFVAITLIVGRWQGLRSLASLAASIFIILYFFLPTILKGVSPILASIGFATLMLAVAMYATHGFGRKTHAAFLGTVASILLTGILALWATAATRLTGFDSDAAVYLNLATDGSINFGQLLLGAIIIGVLGILDDIAITQAAFVAELKDAASTITRSEAYHRAIRVGREHVGALVNTLALAYTGAALPLLLLFYNASANTSVLINREIFAVEIVRIMVGSIGLVLAVPIATLFAVWLLIPKKPNHA